MAGFLLGLLLARVPQSTSTLVLSVLTPKGTSAVTDIRSKYCCDAIYPGTVSDNARNIVTFLVPTPGTGAYTMTLKNDSLVANGTAPATWSFTV